MVTDGVVWGGVRLGSDGRLGRGPTGERADWEESRLGREQTGDCDTRKTAQEAEDWRLANGCWHSNRARLSARTSVGQMLSSTT